MPKRISVAKHLSVEELEKRYRQAKDGIIAVSIRLSG
jgi:hypothetical protein